jgi:hypothetical protein
MAAAESNTEGNLVLYIKVTIINKLNRMIEIIDNV